MERATAVVKNSKKMTVKEVRCYYSVLMTKVRCYYTRTGNSVQGLVPACLEASSVFGGWQRGHWDYM